MATLAEEARDVVTETTERGDGDGDAGSLERGEVFDLLSNRRRRYAVLYCKREEAAVSLGELAEHVAAWELEKPVEAITSTERKRVYTSLQQTHLPTLERAGMIAYDGRTIELTDRAADLEVYLDIVPGDSIPWGTYYLGLAALGFVVLGGVALEVVPTETIPELGWAALFLCLFAGSALVHVLSSRRHRLDDFERPA